MPAPWHKDGIRVLVVYEWHILADVVSGCTGIRCIGVSDGCGLAVC